MFHNRGESAPTISRAGQLVQKLPLKILAPHAAQDMFVARKSVFRALPARPASTTMIGTFSVPARWPRSCLPPTSSGVTWRCVRNFQKTDAARPAEFVRRAAEKIAFAQSFGRHLAEPLHGIAEERHFVLLADGQHFAPRLNDAGLVVRGHHGDESGPHVGQFDGEPVQVNHAVVRDGNEFRALAEIMFRRIPCTHGCSMAEIQISAFGSSVCAKWCSDHVVGLGRAAGPDDVGRMAAEERGEFFARLGHGLVGRRAELVRAGRVAADVLGGVRARLRAPRA